MPIPDSGWRPSPKPDPLPSASERASVWVVDDNPLEAEVVAESLASEFDAVAFTSGAAVLERLGKGEAPNVVVLDWYMPDVSGAEVCRFSRTAFNSGELPILVLTGIGSDADLTEALAIGANDFVKKPASTVELHARVSGLVRLAKLHVRLSEAERKLRLEAAFREHFMATLAHDLRQPLSTVLMGAQVLTQLQLPAAAVAVVERQRRAAERMQRMVTDLLESTRQRPDRGMPIEKVRVDFAEVARTVLDELRAAHPDRQIHLSSDGAVNGYWDPDRLAQILSNLVGNALAHGAPHSAVEVLLTGGHDTVELAVANRGQPIPDEVVQTLGQPFGRMRNVLSSGGGLGLGLHIVHHIVHAHSGTLSVENRAGETRVLVRLPREARDRAVS